MQITAGAPIFLQRHLWERPPPSGGRCAEKNINLQRVCWAASVCAWGKPALHKCAAQQLPLVSVKTQSWPQPASQLSSSTEQTPSPTHHPSQFPKAQPSSQNKKDMTTLLLISWLNSLTYNMLMCYGYQLRKCKLWLLFLTLEKITLYIVTS